MISSRPAKGGLGPATQTVWMSPLADKFTCLMPWSETAQPNYQILPVPLHSCNFVNQFSPNHVSLTTFTTAPDGTTNTAQKFVEDTSNGLHYLFAQLSGTNGSTPVMRCAGIFKAAERTRIAFQVKDYGSGNTINVGFDLAGVQIAYGPGPGGVSVLGPMSASIRSLGSVGGGGWCLCIWDVPWGVVSNALPYYIILDNGAGTAPQSLSYAGTAGNGVYGWRCSLLPKRCWGMGYTSFLTDFNDPTLAEFDLLNVKDPSKKWFVAGNWPGPAPAVSNTGWLDNNSNFSDGRNDCSIPVSPASLSATGSVLTFKAQSAHTPGGLPTIATAASNGDGTFVGQGFKPPYLIESSFKYPPALQPVDSTGGAGTFTNLDFWAGGLESAAQCSAPIGTPSNPTQRVNRSDGSSWIHWNSSWWETAAGEFPIPQPSTGPAIGHVTDTNPGHGTLGMNGPTLAGPSPVTAILGLPDFMPGFNYDVSQPIWNSNINSSGNNFWQCASLTPANTPPPDAHWSPYVYGTAVIPNYYQRVPFRQDITDVFQLCQVLILPWDPINKDPGCFIQFNGYNCAGMIAWRPFGQDSGATGQDNANLFLHRCDWQQQFQMFWGGLQTGSGLNWQIDFVRVTQ